RDVDRAIAAERGDGVRRTAIIGHLLLADHRQTDLHRLMRQYGEIGVIPLELPVTSANGATGLLTSDRRTSVLRHDYRPVPPELNPVKINMQLLDPDIVDLESDPFLENFRLDPADVLKRLTLEARFKSELYLMIEVGLTL